jgi:glycosyltransferase involved in cell wall biosynthesis
VKEDANMSERPLVSVVLPCLNEEEGLKICIDKIQRTFANANIDGEIIVCDNGSTDNSVAIAKSMGVRVVYQPLRGYGNAYMKGFASARGSYVIMGDADATYDFGLIPDFLDKLMNRGYDFVTGSRYIENGHQSIPLLHRFFGNPLLTAILNVLFRTRYTDVYCGFRGFSRKSYDLIRPVSPGMEFNLELAINAGLAGLKTVEVPIQLGPRRGSSKLRTFRDGWRSLRIMLLYFPNKLFLWPGGLLFAVGILTQMAILLGLVEWGGRLASGVTGVFGMVFSMVGFQILSLGLHAKTYSWSRRFDKSNATLEWFYNHFKLEGGLVLGAGLITLGVFILGLLVIHWLQADMLPLPRPEWASFGATLVIIGCNICFSSLFISAMSMENSPDGKQLTFTIDRAVERRESPGIDTVTEGPIAVSQPIE